MANSLVISSIASIHHLLFTDSKIAYLLLFWLCPFLVTLALDKISLLFCGMSNSHRQGEGVLDGQLTQKFEADQCAWTTLKFGRMTRRHDLSTVLILVRDNDMKPIASSSRDLVTTVYASMHGHMA